MRRTGLTHCILFSLLFLPRTLHATVEPTRLDLAKIKEDYDKGDYRSVTGYLETYCQRNEPSSLVDSIFIARYLSVLYSMDPKTIAKGKYYMLQLLNWVPADDLADLSPSLQTSALLENIREEYIAFEGTPLKQRRPATDKPANDRLAFYPRITRKALWWTGGGLVVLTGGVVWMLIQPENKTERKPIQITVEASH